MVIKQEASISHNHKSDEPCPKCGSSLHIRNGKQGVFLGCSSYPECDYLKPIHEFSETKKALTGSCCPKCSKELVLNQGRYGLFVGCSGYPDCQYTSQLSDANEQSPNTIMIKCPSCKNGHLISRQSRFGKQFFSCDNYPKCKYAVNDRPVNEFCPDCRWPILIERKTPSGLRMICPQKGCGYKGKYL